MGLKCDGRFCDAIPPGVRTHGQVFGNDVCINAFTGHSIDITGLNHHWPQLCPLPFWHGNTSGTPEAQVEDLA